VTGSQNFPSLSEDFKKKAKELFAIIQHPWNLKTNTRTVQLVCREHKLVQEWEETVKESLTGDYRRAAFNSVSLHNAIKEHIEEHHS
jgi:hypothetical protein